MFLKKIQNPFFFIIVSITIILHLSCNNFTEPEPFINKDAHSLSLDTTTAILNNYYMNQVVTGDIDPVLVPNLSSSVIDSIRFYIDNTFIVSFKESPYSIQINTREWATGKHNLFYHVYERDWYGDSAGILRLFPFPAHIYKTSLIFSENALELDSQPKYFFDDIGDYVIFIEDHQIESFSTLNCSKVSTKVFYPGKIIARGITFSGTSLVLLALYPSEFYIYYMELPTLETLYNILLSSSSDIWGFAVGRGNRLYFSDGQGTLQILFWYGSISASYNNLFEGPARFLSISPDGYTMIAVDNAGISSYSLNGDSVFFSSQSQINDRIELTRVDWRNSRLFVTMQNTSLEVWNTQTLSPIGSFNLPHSMPTATNITALMTNSKFVYAAYTIQGNENDSSLVVEYDIASRTQTRSWKYANIVQSLLGSFNGSYIFAITFKDQWIVDIGETP